jgi:hypothetical protein
MPFTSPGSPTDPLATYVWHLPQTNITAHAGGTRALAVPLTGQYCRITVSATAADSVAIQRPALAGDEIIIRNDGAAAAQVFPAGNDTINGVAAATGISLASGATAQLICYENGAWRGPVALV